MSRYIYFLLLIYGCVFSQSECKCEPLNTWYKISNNPIDSGRLLELDLSHGFAYADPYTIYLVLIDKSTGEEMVIQFTNNSHFKVDDSILGLEMECLFPWVPGNGVPPFLRGRGMEFSILEIL